MNDDHGESAELEEHPARRLAQGAFTAVDMCDCGSMQLHVGSLTLRMTPRALAELRDTLNYAIRALRAETAQTLPVGALGLGPHRPGDA